MISNIITVTSTDLIIAPPSSLRFLIFQRRMTIPLSHVVGASTGYGIINEEGLLWRLGGVSLFGTRIGFFNKNGVRAYINIKEGEEPLLIQLCDEKCDQLILGVEDAQRIIQQIYRPQFQASGAENELSEVNEEYSKLDKITQLVLDLLIIIAIASIFVLLTLPAEKKLLFFNVAVSVIIVLIFLDILLNIIGKRKKQNKK